MRKHLPCVGITSFQDGKAGGQDHCLSNFPLSAQGLRRPRAIHHE
jgi:hypothetical protein